MLTVKVKKKLKKIIFDDYIVIIENYNQNIPCNTRLNDNVQLLMDIRN